MKLTESQRKKVIKFAKSLQSKKLNEQTYVIKSMPDETVERMNGLVKISDMDDFIGGATGIMSDLTADGFESKEVFDYLYIRLIAEV